MEKRIFGIILTVLGITGLIMGAVNFMNGGYDEKNIKEVIIFGLLGMIFFFSGVGLLRNTKDKAT